MYRVREMLFSAFGSESGLDEVITLESALGEQMGWCRAPGTPALSAEVLAAVVDDLGSGGRLREQLPRTVRRGDYVGLRIMACVHRLALSGRAQWLVPWLPTLGGTNPLCARDPETAVMRFRRAAREALLAHPTELERALAQPPQTNDPRRAAFLRLGLSHLRADVPVRLFELGASAGINLRPEALPGLPGRESGPLPPVVERRGCDVRPIDPATAHGRETLLSYVWIDDLDRFERLEAALHVVTPIAATVVAADAADFVGSLRRRDGVVTVVWHSALAPYLPPAARERVAGAIEALSEGAGPGDSLVHLSWETVSREPLNAVLVSRTWSGCSARPATQVLLSTLGRKTEYYIPPPRARRRTGAGRRVRATSDGTTPR